LVSIASPCVLPLLPAYLTYLAGGSPDLLERPTPALRLATLAKALLFVGGFATVFVALGLTASGVGQLLQAYGPLLRRLSGLLVVVFGLHLLGLFRWLLLAGEGCYVYRPVRTGPASAFLLGASMGFGWTPCIGPVLASILLLAGSTRTVAEGGMLLAAYSAGLALPFLAMAVWFASLQDFLRRLRPWLPRIQRAAGALLTAVGVLILLNAFTVVNAWVRWPF
ncbi:MAG: sulfite exporter TauE/SafE family protein, partial [Clostridia bacterium]|nr:sulfite exporter TauE/SafE family protein [Clostridia bacterium]